MKQNLPMNHATARTRAPSSGRRTFRRLTAAVLCLSALLLFTNLATFSASAASTVRVTLDGKEILPGQSRMIGSTTYVPFRAFVSAADPSAKVSWNASQRTATASGSMTLCAKVGSSVLQKNGTSLSAGGTVRLIGGTLYLPVRGIAAAYSISVSWNAGTRTVSLTSAGKQPPSTSSSSSSSSSSPSSPTVSSTDLYWLSRIIEAEAGGEPYRGKLAVGAVILNRVASPSYPNTVYGVIFDKKYGTQFTPTANGRIYNTPSAESVAAAREVLEGNLISTKILFFVNPRLASDSWFRKNLTYCFTIGGHDFYGN